MIVTWLGHASLFLNAGGKTLLVDPWFTEPVDGRYRFPPPPYDVANAMPRPDFLLLSCAKNEHASEATLGQLKRDTVTLAAPEVTARLSALGFSKVTPQG
ncbi:MAG: MBL fold metallo-hydrolase, partial [Archangium sp.]